MKTEIMLYKADVEEFLHCPDVDPDLKKMAAIYLTNWDRFTVQKLMFDVFDVMGPRKIVETLIISHKSEEVLSIDINIA